MKILHIANINNSKSDGVDVVVPQHVAAQSKTAEVSFYNIRNIRADGLSGIQLDFKNSDELCRYIEKSAVNLIVFHEVNEPKYLAIYKKLLKIGVPYIIVPHGELNKMALKRKWLKKKIAYLLFFDRFIRKASAIQCLSQHELQSIKIKTPQKFVATNGVYVPNSFKSGFNSDICDIVYIGRIDSKVKGIDLLTEAAGSIKDFLIENNVAINIYGPDILGRGDAVRELINKNGVEDIVSLNAPIYGEDKENRLLTADLFIQTSRHEGMPCGILEALSFGLPCIVTLGTNMLEDVTAMSAGYGAGETAEEIADAIIAAVNDREEWGAKSRNAVKLINEKYTWDIAAKNALDFYGGLIN